VRNITSRQLGPWEGVPIGRGIPKLGYILGGGKSKNRRRGRGKVNKEANSRVSREVRKPGGCAPQKSLHVSGGKKEGTLRQARRGGGRGAICC